MSPGAMTVPAASSQRHHRLGQLVVSHALGIDREEPVDRPPQRVDGADGRGAAFVIVDGGGIEHQFA